MWGPKKTTLKLKTGPILGEHCISELSLEHDPNSQESYFFFLIVKDLLMLILFDFFHSIIFSSILFFLCTVDRSQNSKPEELIVQYWKWMIYSIRIENQREKGTQVIHSNVNTSVGNNILKTHLSLPFNNKTQKKCY